MSLMYKYILIMKRRRCHLFFASYKNIEPVLKISDNMSYQKKTTDIKKYFCTCLFVMRVDTKRSNGDSGNDRLVAQGGCIQFLIQL